jgi:hypothetical protein
MPRSAMAARMASVARCVSPETSRSLRPKIGVGLVNQRDQGCEVSRIGAALLGNDDLMRGINRDLTITAGDETTAAWHDATIAIGEVTLRPVWRCGGLLSVGSKLLARAGLVWRLRAKQRRVYPDAGIIRKVPLGTGAQLVPRLCRQRDQLTTEGSFPCVETDSMNGRHRR